MISFIPPLLVKPLLYIGLVVALKHALYIVYWVLNCLKCKIFARRLRSYGDTVIITGCTDGIGKSLAYSLIRENVNLFLISRNEDALKSMKEDLLVRNRNYKGQIDYATFDYNTGSFTSYRGIQEKIEKLDVGILINNVGVSYPHPLIELREHNIQVQCHVPLFIVTKLSKIRKPSTFVPTADAYAKSAIKRMKQGNSTSSSVISSPYFLHRVQICLYNAVPKLLFDTMSLMTLKAVRQRALKKVRKGD
ncbi:steroid dehydrogenase kik-i [Plasmodium cynomolgi strain B]|uniref:Steroid dehydrogenase kik-i n=1 Tax=Plasmodium cynomolgi (strain B) TaxID=1120755 RepID=K6UCS0_PLACD|nr:steroid dehydrogenase kik-i [Plasmodium cynomolgi strain B]GAB65336.1 steroid dehydrogenase kik-i [Plasmodium cynomolgi strain B]